MSLLSAQQTAHRLGVKVQTVYAYASRGVLRRHVGDDGRTSWFDQRDVDALARRGRPRRSTRETSIDLLIETSLTSISDDGVRYRGIPSATLARTMPFEHVAELLWTGEAAKLGTPWVGTRFEFEAHPPPVQVARRVTAALVPAVGSPVPDVAEVAAAGRLLVASVVDSLGPPTGRVPTLVLPDGSGPYRRSIAARLALALCERRPTPEIVAAVNALLVLMADHELAASTLAARVAASTRANPMAVALAGLGAMQGALHGGASTLARRLLDDALDNGAPAAVARAGKRVPGFGHRVYPGIDPRAAVLLSLLKEQRTARRVATVTDDVIALVADQYGVAPNIDLAIAALTRTAGMATDAGEVLATVARFAGWLAHGAEEYAEAPLRFRPRASYVGA